MRCSSASGALWRYALRLAESSINPNRKTKAAPPISTAEWMRLPSFPSPAK